MRSLLTRRSLRHPDIPQLAEFAEGLLDVSLRGAGFQVADVNLAFGSPIAVSGRHLSTSEKKPKRTTAALKPAIDPKKTPNLRATLYQATISGF